MPGAAANADCHLRMQILLTADLCKGEDVFFAATGVSDSDLVQGVRFHAGGATSNSIVMRSKSRTVRYITTQHTWHSGNRELQE